MAAAGATDWQWADRPDPIVLHRMAVVALRLFRQPERWIHRRVERVYFKDYRSARHQVSVDFTLPAGMQRVGTFDAGTLSFLYPDPRKAFSSDAERLDTTYAKEIYPDDSYTSRSE